MFTLGKDQTDSALYLSPRAALSYAQKQRSEGKNVLLIQDSIMDYLMTERKIFDILNAPFGQFNLIHHIMENSGNFKTGSMSSILLFDSNVMNFNYEGL